MTQSPPERIGATDDRSRVPALSVSYLAPRCSADWLRSPRPSATARHRRHGAGCDRDRHPGGHGTPRSVSSRAMLATLRPATAVGNIHCTCGAVTGIGVQPAQPTPPTRVAHDWDADQRRPADNHTAAARPDTGPAPGPGCASRPAPGARAQNLPLGTAHPSNRDQRPMQGSARCTGPPDSGGHTCTPKPVQQRRHPSELLAVERTLVLTDHHSVEPSSAEDSSASRPRPRAG